MAMLASGCSIVPNMPSFGNKKSTTVEDVSSKDNVAAIVAGQTAKDAMDKASAVEQKAEEDKKKMQDEYAKMKAEMQKAYEDLKKKDQDNFDKIGELNYGIYFVTQEKKKVDINTTIAHLRSKEVMIRTDKLNDIEKAEIQKEVADEKSKTVDQLYIKYKQTIDLAVNQKAQLDDAEALIIQKEKEKAQIKEVNRLAIEKIESDRKIEVEKLKADAIDQVRIAQEMAKQERSALIMNMLTYSLGGVGILFIILSVLLKKINLLVSGIIFIGLAVGATMVPTWIVATTAGILLLVSVILTAVTNKQKTE
jgi:hypothetical protein